MRVTTRHIEFKIDRSETVTVRPATRRMDWCGRCQTTVQMVSAEAAASIFHTTMRVIFRMIEADQVHFVETDSGQMLLCAESLSHEEPQKQ